MTTGWTVSIEVAGDTAAVTDDAIDAFLDNLYDHSGAVSSSIDGTRYGATLSIDGDLGPLAAIATGYRIFVKCATDADLPAYPIVRAEAMTYAEHDADIAREAAR